jgi:hypothetical protein
LFRLPDARLGRALGFIAAALLSIGLGKLAGLNLAFAAVPPVGTGSEALDGAAVVGTPIGFVSRARHLALLGADRWQEVGYRGQNIKIAILDWGFRGYRDHLGGILPQKVIVHSYRDDGDLEARDSQHGILCAEVVHALAPDAEILLANWDQDQPERFLDAVRWALQQGARILTCSLIMPTWSDGEGGGLTHQKLARLLQSSDGRDELLCFASAGNTAQRHWTGGYRAGRDRWHEWQPGQTDNALTLWQTEQVSIEACWRPRADYAVAVVDQATGQEIEYLLSKKRTQDCAIARFRPVAGHTYAVRLRLLEGQPGSFHLVALGASLQYSTAGGSIPFPADGTSVIAVGAVSADGRRLYYSSCGAGPRPKPELVAPVPFASLWRAQPFSGTSAAAPQAAALAALLWSRHPDWTAAHIRQALFASAHDVGTPGPDSETGYGMIALPDLAGGNTGLPRAIREESNSKR